MITSSGFSPAAKRPEAKEDPRPEPQLDEARQRPAFSEPAPGATLATEPPPSAAMTETTTEAVVKPGAQIPT
ncbi:hypothetical protein ACFSC4_08765 [Deinococcus malanensis]|uniref:hypothetical protein n=1 Tax=Deinococcus malanensis TaxID=1706855 RepID=UPI00362F2522